jgi:hypothetical protein
MQNEGGVAMKKVLIALVVGWALAAAPAVADERADLVKDISAITLQTQAEQVDAVVPVLMRELGADSAGLTADEKTKLKTGLTLTLTEVVSAIITNALQDPAKFDVDDLRQIKAFVGSPAGAKWARVVSSFDAKDPKSMQLVLTSMFKNVDMAIFSKLAIASAQKKDGR